ncbi:hypothetical protein LWI28_025355 [Acer negundo]|uniref:Uncharacterized protein n=1 Tax=Acer negundo TaxID=4023 RepID=A0AAD5JUA5_ACENE|nr:hypothetical protein LWI28_025355 [Acer negundo]
MVEEVGEDVMVQVVMDNALNYKKTDHIVGGGRINFVAHRHPVVCEAVAHEPTHLVARRTSAGHEGHIARRLHKAENLCREALKSLKPPNPPLKAAIAATVVALVVALVVEHCTVGRKN